MSKTFLSAVLTLTLSATTASADPYWYAIAPSEDCKCDGFRTYTGWLTGVPEGQSSTEACYNTPAIINGHSFSGADRCIKFGIQVGYFDVGDASCSSTGTDPSLWSCYQDPGSTDPACQICHRKLNCDTGQIKRTC